MVFLVYLVSLVSFEGGIRMNGVDYDEAKVFFKRIYSRIEEQESLGRKMFKDKEDIEAWEVLKKWFRKEECGDSPEDPLDFGEEYRKDVF